MKLNELIENPDNNPKQEEAERTALLARPKRGSQMKMNMQNLQHLPSIAKRYTKKQVAEAIEQAHGLTSSICAALDCTTQQYLVYLRTHQELKQLQEECRMDLVNEAEEVMRDNLHDVDPSIRQKAAEFVLNRLGRKTGWGAEQMFGITIDQNEQTKQVKAIFGISE